MLEYFFLVSLRIYPYKHSVHLKYSPCSLAGLAFSFEGSVRVLPPGSLPELPQLCWHPALHLCSPQGSLVHIVPICQSPLAHNWASWGVHSSLGLHQQAQAGWDPSAWLYVFDLSTEQNTWMKGTVSHEEIERDRQKHRQRNWLVNWAWQGKLVILTLRIGGRTLKF